MVSADNHRLAEQPCRLAPAVLIYSAMPAKKAAKKVAKKAAAEVPAKKAAKKAAKKTSAAKKPAATKEKGAKAPADLHKAAYLNYRSRVEKGEHGDPLGDWLAAEKSPEA